MTVQLDFLLELAWPGAKYKGNTLLKSSRNKKDLNDVTAAPFSVVFLLLAAEKKTPKMGQL